MTVHLEGTCDEVTEQARQFLAVADPAPEKPTAEPTPEPQPDAWAALTAHLTQPAPDPWAGLVAHLTSSSAATSTHA